MLKGRQQNPRSKMQAYISQKMSDLLAEKRGEMSNVQGRYREMIRSYLFNLWYQIVTYTVFFASLINI